MLADARALGHGRHGLLAEVLGVRRRVADPPDPSHRVDGAEQVGEAGPVLPGTEIAPVGVDVLAEEGDLAHAVAGQLLDLPHDVAHAPAHLAATHQRNDAEGARVVAADLDRDPRGVVDLPPGRQRGG